MKLSMPSYDRSKHRDCVRPVKGPLGGRMMKLLLIASVFFLPYTVTAQALFTYGKHAVSKNEFLNAYNKNNNDSSVNKLSVEEYLDLYIKFRLKVQDALDSGLDTTAQQQSELRSFRYQLAENFLKADASINLLVEEAFDRSLKDIHLSHIFVPVMKSASDDSVRLANDKINDAYERLQRGESFEKVAASYMHKSLGYITAFVLPYQPETISYSTKPGKYSAPFQTPSGFHIIRNDFERKAEGKIRAAQILLAFRPDDTEESRQKLQQRADSVYDALQKGSDFTTLVKEISDDHLTLHTNGEMPAFGVGQYDTAFEHAVFSLEKDGDITTPIKTSFGYHIVKRLQRIPVIEDRNNKEWKEVLRERVLQSDRMEVAQDRLIQSIRQVVEKDASPADLSSDSSVLEYYRNHLEKYNEEFSEQLKEFGEGNLLFTIMQEKVWDAAVEDTAGLAAYYHRNKEKYRWENSATALIITSIIPDSTENAMATIKNDYKSWRQIVENSNGILQADSGRFELSQIPVVERTNFTEGLVTAPVINEQDSSRTFAYIIKLFTGAQPKAFRDARGAVINDYQAYLEEQWIAVLKRKYPVKVNAKTLRKIKEEKGEKDKSRKRG